MSLNNLFSRTRLSEPFNVWKVKHRVHYKDDGVVEEEENNQITTDSGEGGGSKPKIIPKSSSLAKLYIPRNRIDDRQLSPPTTSTAAATATTVIRTARSPCDCCGHHNIPIMSHLPVSPLARSQNNLEMVETTSARQALLPAPAPPTGSSMRHEDSSSSLGPLTSLQISRRPSIMLQEILTTRFNGAKKDAKNGQPPRHPKNVGSLTDTANGSSWTMDVGSKSLQAKQSKDKNRRTGNDAISTALSATYCKLLVLLGVCLPITEVISDQIPTYVYQGFYVYLYSGSILFVIFLYITAFRHRTIFNALKDFHEQNNNVHLKHKVHHFGSFYLRVGAIAFAIGTMVYSGLEFGQFFELNGHPGCRDVFVAITPICRMVLCIVQVQFIFLNTTYLDMARHKVTSRFGLMHMVATNLCEWLYVLVEETKHEIFHIGMHGEEDEAAMTGGKHGGVDWTAINATMNAHTNHVVDAMKGVTASVASTVVSKASQLLANVTTTLATPTNFNANHSTDHAQHIVGCTRTNIMGALVQEVSPFLFPCTIEYSLICAVILYEMWKTVKSIPDIDRTRKHSIKPTVQKPAHHFSVDCSQSHKGLFFGILIIVMTIISMIMYFVLYMQPGFELIATQEVTLWETVMYFCCALAIVVGMILMRDLKYVNVSTDDHHSMELDNMLLVVAQTGVYLYGMFSILGSYFSKWDTVPDRVEGIVAEVFGLAQTSLQTMFILHSSHRRCKGAKQQRRKPGREIITFLLVANIAIWFVNTLIKGRAVFRETHLEFFGVWGWTIITHVSMPLAIFYRFHSTICLFEVWKVTYKAKAH